MCCIDASCDKPHGESSTPQKWRLCSNFKYVLTQNQKLLTIMGQSFPPFFPLWSLIRPQGEPGRNTDTWIFSLHFLWHFLADLGIVSHCEISFHSKIWALISPHLRLMKKPPMINEDSCVSRWVFICLTLSRLVSRAVSAAVQICMTVIKKIWQLDSERWDFSNNQNTQE